MRRSGGHTFAGIRGSTTWGNVFLGIKQAIESPSSRPSDSQNLHLPNESIHSNPLNLHLPPTLYDVQANGEDHEAGQRQQSMELLRPLQRLEVVYQRHVRMLPWVYVKEQLILTGA